MTGKRQKGQTTSRATQYEDRVITYPRLLMLKDVDMRKLAINLPYRQTSKKLFSQLPSPAGLFSQSGSDKHLFPTSHCFSAYQGDILRDRRIETGLRFSEILADLQSFTFVGLRLRIFGLASTYSEPFRIHGYRGNGKLAHGPYQRNSLAQVANARALSAVSKAIQHENSTLFYQVNSFSIIHDPHPSGTSSTLQRQA